MSLSDFLTVDMDADSHSAYAHSNSWTPTVYSTMASPNITPADDVVPSWLASTAPSLSVSDYSGRTAAPPSILSPSPSHACIPGGLSQISLSSSDSERSLSPELATLPAGFHLENPAVSAIKHLSPHPYSISPSNTTALFTRASSVSSMSSENMSGKKSRAPPSGPISTKDFIPPDVSGLSKREARLVKNRAAAFLSRQRKREEFEGLEARVQVLEADNARLYTELDEARSNPSPTSQSSSSYTPADAAALAAELAGLKRQLAARDAELKTIHSRLRGLVNVQEQLSAERERSAERDAELEALRRKVEDESTAAGSGDEEDVKVGRGAGGMAFMVLLFSLSTLLTQGNTPSTPARPARALGHRRGDSQTFLGASDFLASPSYTYPGLSGSSSFASLAKDVPSTPSPIEQDTLRKAAEKAISGVKSTNPGEYEFDFHLPHSPTPVSVRVKAPGTHLPKDQTLFDTFPSPFEFRPDDDLDFSGTRASPAATVVSSPPAIGKRKRVVEVEFAMPQQRRRVEDDWMGMGGEWSMPILGV